MYLTVNLCGYYLLGRDSNRRLYARAGIRTRVGGVTVPHTEPEYTMQNLIILIVHLYTTRAH
jgi:hypothetical protein